MKATWGEGREAIVVTLDDFRALLEIVRRIGQPTIVFLEAERGNTLAVGVGRDESVLVYTEPDGTCYHSLGDPERQGYLVFFALDQPDDYFAELAIPEQQALEAAELFVTTSERPSGIRWEADWDT